MISYGLKVDNVPWYLSICFLQILKGYAYWQPILALLDTILDEQIIPHDQRAIIILMTSVIYCWYLTQSLCTTQWKQHSTVMKKCVKDFCLDFLFCGVFNLKICMTYPVPGGKHNIATVFLCYAICILSELQICRDFVLNRHRIKVISHVH